MVNISGQGRSDGGYLEEWEHHDPRWPEPVQLCLLHLGLVHRLPDLLSSRKGERIHSGGQSSHHGWSCWPSSCSHQEVWGAEAEMNLVLNLGADKTRLDEISSSRQHKWQAAGEQLKTQGFQAKRDIVMNSCANMYIYPVEITMYK